MTAAMRTGKEKLIELNRKAFQLAGPPLFWRANLLEPIHQKRACANYLRGCFKPEVEG